MTSAEKKHQQELKRPDAIQIKLANILDWLLINLKYLVIGAVPIAAAVGIFYLYQSYQANQRMGRVEELSKVQLIYQDEERKAASQRDVLVKQMEALEPKPTPPKEGAPAPAEPLAPSPEVVAKKEELKKQADAVKADHSGSLAKFLEFSQKYPDRSEGWVASMTAARILSDKESFADARKIYQEVLAKSKNEAFYQIQATIALVGVLEELNEFDSATAEIDSLIKQLDAGQSIFVGLGQEVKPRLLLEKSKIFIFKNSRDDAKKTLTQLIDQFGSSNEAQKARSLRFLVN